MNLIRKLSTIWFLLLFVSLVTGAWCLSFVQAQVSKPTLEKSAVDGPPVPFQSKDSKQIAQNSPEGRPAFHKFTDEEGLPQNSINTMTFDRKGYLWVGTQDGAAYYNGRVWTVVNMPNRTDSNYINSILAASDGALWFGSGGGGVSCFQDGKWTNFKKELPSQQVVSLCETTGPDGSSTIWVGTSNGLAYLNRGNWNFYNTKNSGLPDNWINCLIGTKDSNGTSGLWIGTSHGLAHFYKNQWEVFTTENSGLPNLSIYCLLETVDAAGAHFLWMGTSQGLTCFHKGQWTTYTTKNSGLPENDVRSLLEVTQPEGTPLLWIGMLNGGLTSFHNGQWSTYTSKTSGLPNDSVLSLLETPPKSGQRTLWIGTDGGGLVRMHNGQWTIYDSKTAGLPNNVVQSFLETKADDGTPIIWIGVSGHGLARLEHGRWAAFDSQPGGVPGKEVSSLVETIEADRTRSLWVGTLDNGLGRYAKNRWTTFTSKNSRLPDDAINCLTKTTEANGTSVVWIGTSKGLACVDQGGQWKTFDTSNSGLPNNEVVCLLSTTEADGSPTIWVGTNGSGIARFHQNQWSVFDKINSGLPHNSVYSLFESQPSPGQHILWAGMDGGGVAWRPVGQTVRWNTISDTTTPHLPNNIVYQICEDQFHRMYLTTNKGIVRLTPRTPTPDNPAPFNLYTFTIADGLPSNECNQGASMVDSQGRIWVGTVGGAAVFDPSKETTDHVAKPLLIERTLLNGHEFIRPGGMSLQNATLNYQENNLVFEYALLSYFREADTSYKTQLVGLEETPSEWTEDHKKEYTTLPKGRYVFKLWGKDYAGNVTGPIEIGFTIQPAPWQTWWAYLIYGGTLAGFGYGVVRIRLKALQHRNEILEAKVKQRTQELAQKNCELDQKVEELAHKNEELIRSKEDLIQSHKRAERIFTALADALPGTVLDNKYRLDEKIGAGGFGAVYRGTHLAMRRPVAIKVFRPAGSNASVESLDRFQMEAVSMCRVNHPNAVAVMDSGISSNGIAYLVMELLQGRTLSQELKESGKCSPQRCAELILPVCDVLAKAHAAGIIHRDIKPDNIFLHQSEDGEIVKVVDFGIAKLMGETVEIEMQSLTAAGNIIGTPTYMSPERLDNKPYDGRADVYSLGVLMYQMLSGRLPFQSESGILGLILQHLTQEPPPLREIAPEIPPNVEQVVTHALAKNPNQRPTAKELAAELAAAIGIRPTPQIKSRFGVITDGRSTSSQEVSTANFQVQFDTSNMETVTGPTAHTTEELADLETGVLPGLSGEQKINSSSNLENLPTQAVQKPAFLSEGRDFFPGELFENKYRIEDRLGAGGFGTVYKATHLGLHRAVAIKIFQPKGGMQSREGLERFQREGISSCRIMHPNAVTVLDSGVSANGVAYLVMELLEGIPLGKELEQKKRLSLERCLQIIILVCDVLAEAHAAGIVHRDIKPDNIFLHQAKSTEIVKVVDFGIAKLINEKAEQEMQPLTAVGSFLGTPLYTSPERVLDMPYDGRTDVYSVGMVLYEMLSGCLPFMAEIYTWRDLVNMHLHQKPRSLREIVPEIPVELEEIVFKALEKDPHHRPTAKELEEMLKLVAKELKIEI